ncbi:MAG: hypothetical protein PHE79_02010 [Eubacteriales bacterium]|nr:hypothetical protein [Eubacteriales bacterium]
MKKKYFIIFTIILIVIIVAIAIFYSIETQEKGDAIALAKNYQRYIMSNQPEEAAKLLSSNESPDNVVSFNNLDSEDAKDLVLAANNALVNMDNYFKLKSVEKKDGVYTIIAQINIPNYPKIALSLPRYGIFTDWSSADEYITQASDDGTLPVDEQEQTYYIIKENGVLKVQFSLY